MSTTNDNLHLTVTNEVAEGIHSLLAGPTFRTDEDVQASLDAGWSACSDAGHRALFATREVDLLVRCVLWHAARHDLTPAQRFVARELDRFVGR